MLLILPAIFYLPGFVACFVILVLYSTAMYQSRELRTHFWDAGPEIASIRANTVQLAYASGIEFGSPQRPNGHEIMVMASPWKTPPDSKLVEPQMHLSYYEKWCKLHPSDRFFLRYNLIPLGMR
jgi:hypothetical protein